MNAQLKFDELITTAQYAKRLGVTVNSVNKWLRQGRIPHTKIGRKIFIPANTPRPKNRRLINNYDWQSA